jgi:hypothetical protein
VSGGAARSGAPVSALFVLEPVEMTAVLLQGDLIVQSNAALSAIDQVTSFGRITGNLNIASNAALSTINGMTGLTSLGGYVSITRLRN